MPINVQLNATMSDLAESEALYARATGLTPTWAAVSLGACFVERHITLDRAMWGSDQAASVEIIGIHQLVRSIRDTEKALGDGIKRVYASELGALKKLRRVVSSNGNGAAQLTAARISTANR